MLLTVASRHTKKDLIWSKNMFNVLLPNDIFLSMLMTASKPHYKHQYVELMWQFWAIKPLTFYMVYIPYLHWNLIVLTVFFFLASLQENPHQTLRNSHFKVCGALCNHHTFTCYCSSFVSKTCHFFLSSSESTSGPSYILQPFSSCEISGYSMNL